MSEEKSPRVLSRRGLRRGCRSRSFSLDELRDAGQGGRGENIYIEMDGSGQLVARGGAARAARGARLAPAPPHASALLCLQPAPAPPASPAPPAPAPPAPPAPARLALRLAADVPPLHELLLWFDEHTLAHLDMPFLTLCNITGKKNYSCHHCNTEFEHPNPLKIHMFLSCRPYEEGLFWSRCISRLRTAAAPPATQLSALPPPPPPPPADPAQLEALAAAWGRSRDGHVCLYCGKLYSRKYGLKIHIRTHTGYKPLRCRHCLRAFGDPSNLNKHVRLHAAAAQAGGPGGGAGGEGGGAGGAHACPLCRKPLARRRDLRRHVRTHHPHHPHHALCA